jgi:hypothetical protein
MKNGNSIRAQEIIVKGMAPMKIAKVDPARSEAAFRAWESRERAAPEGEKPEAKPEKQYPHLLHLNGAIDSMKSSGINIKSASESLDRAMQAKTRGEATEHLMQAFRNYKTAAEFAGHAGADRAATTLRSTASSVAEQIDRLYDDKRDNPDYGPLKDSKESGELAQAHMEEYKGEIERHRASEGVKSEGAVPGYKKLASGAGSRVTTFSGGPEMRAHRDEIRQHLHSLGFGKVDEVKSEAGGQQNSRTHELWEHSDGRTVRITHDRDGAGKTELQHITVKERAPDRWKATRKEFVTSYHGNEALNAHGAKPGLAPKGVKVGRESELPFMPEEPA